MKPYYHDEAAGITLYHGDCRDILPTLGSVDLVLTDPPYNLGIEYGAQVNDRNLCYAEWCNEWFRQCLLVAATVAISPGIANISLWYTLKKPDWMLCWHKPAAMGRAPVGYNNWEPLLLWGKSKGRNGADVVTAPIVTDSAIDKHPCPKPLQWAKGFIGRLSSDESTILDHFAGSGTTLRAAKDMGRKAIGIDIFEAYAEIAAKRLEQGVFQYADTKEDR